MEIKDMKKLKKLVCSMLLIILTLTTISAGLRLSGAVFEADVKPGDKVTHEIDLYNTSLPANFTVEVNGLSQPVNGGTIASKPDQDSSSYSARSFLSVYPSQFHLEPGATQVIKVEGDIPNDVGSGGRYAIISIRSNPVSKMTAGQSVVGFSLGLDVPVLFTISGTDLVKKGEITNLSVEEPISGEQENVSLLFRNTGNYHYSGFAKAELTDTNGTQLSNATTPVTISSLFPTFSRLFRLSLVPSSRLRPGTYQINATVNLEDGTILATKKTSFQIKF